MSPHRWPRRSTRRILLLLGLVIVPAFAAVPAPVQSQDPLTVLKKKAEEAKKKADEARRKTAAAKARADSIRAAADSVKDDVETTKAAAEEAARALKEGAGASAATSQPPARAQQTPSAGQKAAPAQKAAPQEMTGPAAQASTSLSRTAAKIEEQILLKAEGGTHFSVSPKGHHVAAVQLRGSRPVVVYDGVDGPKFDEILNGNYAVGAIRFSEDGSRYAYVGRLGQEWVVMVDGKELARGAPWAQSSGAPTIAEINFTPGGKHVWFITKAPDSQRPVHRLYIDGKPGPASEGELGQPLFSPNGERHAYVISVRDRNMNPTQVLIIDGKPSPYPGGEPQFTADGLHVFTTAHVPGTNSTDIFKDGKPFMRVHSAQLHMAPVGSGVLGTVGVRQQDGRLLTFLTIGNQRVPNSDCRGNGGIDRVWFSPDAKYWAIRCQDPSSQWIMANGKKGRDYQHVALTADLTFTADGRPVYLAQMNNNFFLVVGEEESDAYKSIHADWLATQARQGALPPAAIVHGNRVGFIGTSGARSGDRVVIDGKVVESLAADQLRFSPDGKRFAYLVGVSGKQVVADGATPFGPPVADMPVNVSKRPAYAFSSDGRYIAWGSNPSDNQQARAIAVNGKLLATGTTFNHNFTFSPDSKHLFWVGNLLGKPRQVLFVNGERVYEFDTTLGIQNEPDVYSSVGPDGVLNIIVQDGGALKRLRVTPTNTLEGMLAKMR